MRSIYGVPGGSRTHGLSLRRRTLYPTELQKHFLHQVYIHFYVLSNKKRVLEVGFEKTFYHAAKSVDIFVISATITTEYPWGYGSVGRAMRSQRIGQGFESPYLHQWEPRSHPWFLFICVKGVAGIVVRQKSRKRRFLTTGLRNPVKTESL